MYYMLYTNSILYYILHRKVNPHLQVGPSSNVHAHHLQGAPTTEGILDLLQIQRVQLASQNFHEYFEFTITSLKSRAMDEG